MRCASEANPVVSLVAEQDGGIVGHIVFSPVMLVGEPELNIMGLAPMAVVPTYQRQGIGSALVRAGLEKCARLGFGAVVVLGHPTYYPRSGFVPSTRWNIRCEYEAPPEAFMAIEVKQDIWTASPGTIRYPRPLPTSDLRRTALGKEGAKAAGAGAAPLIVSAICHAAA